MKTVQEFKTLMEQRRKSTLARIEKDKAILNRIDLYLSDPEYHFKKVSKSRGKYENKKTKKSVLPPQAEQAPTSKKKNFFDFEL